MRGGEVGVGSFKEAAMAEVWLIFHQGQNYYLGFAFCSQGWRHEVWIKAASVAIAN